MGEAAASVGFAAPRPIIISLLVISTCSSAFSAFIKILLFVPARLLHANRLVAVVVAVVIARTRLAATPGSQSIQIIARGSMAAELSLSHHIVRAPLASSTRVDNET